MNPAMLLSTSTPFLPPDSYIYKTIFADQNASLAAIASDDSLRLFDLETLQLTSGGNFSKVHDGVTCMETVGVDSYCVLTSGRDSAMRCWDLRSGGKAFEINNRLGAAYLSLNCRGWNLAAGTELTHSQATVTIWDYRSPKSSLVQYVESHNDDVSELRFHPTNSAYLLSGSTDGLVNIYDITILDEDEALVQIVNHGSSIHRAGFLSGHDFYALSHDEILSIYQLSNPDETVAEEPHLKFGDLRSLLSCEYVVDVVPLGNGEAIIGAGLHNSHELGMVPLYRRPQWEISPDQALRLQGAHGSELVRSFVINDEAQRVFTAGEDGLIRAWQMPAGESEAQAQVEETGVVGTIGRKRKRANEGKKKDRVRLHPY